MGSGELHRSGRLQLWPVRRCTERSGRGIRDGPEAFLSEWFVDDPAQVEPAVGGRHFEATRALEAAIRVLFGQEAVNAEEVEQEGDWDAKKIIWGLWVDLKAGPPDEPDWKSWRVTMPEEKIAKAFYVAWEESLHFGTKQVPLKVAQRLRGNLQQWAICHPTLLLEAKAIVDRAGIGAEQ